MKKITGTIILVFTLTAFLASCDFFGNGLWIWDIEGEKVTVDEMEDSYEGFLFWWALQFSTTPEQLKEKLENIDEMSNIREREVLSQLTKRSFIEGLPSRGQSPMLKKIILVNLEAKKSGFMDKEGIKKKLDFVNQFLIYNLYLMDKIKPDEMEVSDEEALNHFDEIRRSDPKYKTIPLLKGKQIAKQQLLMQHLMTKQNQIFNNILEAYKIKQNPDFNIESVLSNKEKNAQEEEKKDSNSDDESKDGEKKEGETPSETEKIK